MASSALALLLPRGVPALRAASASLPRRCALGILAAVEPLSPPAAATAGEGAPASSSGGPKATPPLKALHGTPWNLHPDYRRWKDAEEEILRDIEPIRMLTKHILHSDRSSIHFLCERNIPYEDRATSIPRNVSITYNKCLFFLLSTLF
ncbi:uncharacterized protein LOC121970768 isoform X2 [Zingiber officinale]|uniref:uncharacterized protein LOC121970768 isoform X2 n=1 Tax=Zingiber officinale TaxID=94328 RepID=UPI001C4B60EB|nr:uncharacterized protein LOC121970768 isoform X2 [Zingiber officinale]